MGFQYISISVYIVRSHARIQRGDRGSGSTHPWNITKIYHFLAILDQIPWNSQYYQASIQRWVSEMPFKGVSLAGRWWPAFSDIWILSLLKKKNSSDPDLIRMEFRKECVVNLNIWPCIWKHAKHQYCRISDFVVQKTMRTRSISKYHFDIFRDYKQALVSLSLSQSLQIVWIQKISDVLPNRIRDKQDTKN